MPDKQDEILDEVRGIKSEQVKLISWLYGADGHEGDIPEIKSGLKNHSRRIRRIELILAGLAGTGALGAGITGIIKLLVG